MHRLFVFVAIPKRVSHLVASAFDKDKRHAGRSIGKSAPARRQYPIRRSPQTAREVLQNVPGDTFALACFELPNIALNMQFGGVLCVPFNGDGQINLRFFFLPVQIIGNDQPVPLLPDFFVLQFCRINTDDG
jgi:hypothetical protein